MEIEPNFADPESLVTVVVQDAESSQVLMVAHMNQEAWRETIATRRAVYFSRSRNRLWRKGEASGNYQVVKEIFIDCDADAVLLKVHQQGGAACHEGYPSCFFRRFGAEGWEIVAERVFDPKAVYGDTSHVE